MSTEKQFVVTGMHRSATSLVAKGLQEAGVEMGEEDDLLPANEGNPEGYYEDKEFVSLNEAVLRMAGGSWDDPPSIGDTMTKGAALLPAIGEVMSRKRRPGLWGVKDPRFCLTLPLHGQFLAEDTHIVAVFRRPEFAAKSLVKQHPHLSIEQALTLGSVYNVALMQTIAHFVGVAPK